MNTLGALWVVMVSRFIIFHWNEITYCNCLSVTDQQIWQRKAFLLLMGRRNRREWMDWAKFCSDSVRGKRKYNQRGREKKRLQPWTVPWDSLFWPNDLNWASIFQSCEGSEQLMQGDVLGWMKVTALWALYQTQQLSSFLITSTIISLGDTAEVLCLRSTSQQEVWALHSARIRVRQENDPFGLFAFGISAFSVRLKGGKTALGSKHAGSKGHSKGSLQVFGSEDCCTRARYARLRAPLEVQLAGPSNQGCKTCLVEGWAVLALPVGRQQFQLYEESRAGCSCWGRGCLFHLKGISQLCSSRRQRAQGVIKMERASAFAIWHGIICVHQVPCYSAVWKPYSKPH